MDNVITNHLSRILNASDEQTPIYKNFLDERSLAIFMEPCYADIVNYLATEQTPSDWMRQDKYCFFAQV